MESSIRTAPLLIFVPTYNERENVQEMASQLLALNLDADILFCDDNSPDGTGQLLDELAAQHPRLSVRHRSGKLGIGTAHLDGIIYAYEQGYTTLLTMDCDFTHSPTDIPRLLDAMASADADVAVGSRYMRANSLPGWNLLRRSLTASGHILTRTMLGMTQDATGAFRAYRLDRVPRRMFDLVHSRGYAFFFESLFIVYANGLKIVEIPITLPARTYGHSKMSLNEARRSAGHVVRLGLANLANPAQFRLGRAPDASNPSLHDPQGWDDYWGRQMRPTGIIYQLAAACYRRLFIRPNLTRTIHKHFAPGSALLHAGCGGGQVDAEFASQMRITAIDISPPALELYSRNNPDAVAVRHASIFALPFPDAAFDGVYNLGVMEHFLPDEIDRILPELRRVLKPGGKLVLFWPHRYATSVLFLNFTHWLLNDVLHRPTRLHPAELSLLRSRRAAESPLRRAGLQPIEYQFGPADLFVQAILVSRRP